MVESLVLTIVGVNGAGWASPSNIEIEDGSYAGFSAAPDIQTEYIAGIADAGQLPTGVEIEGIKVRLRKYNSTDLNVYDKEVVFFDTSDWSIISENKASPDRWPIGPFDTTYGDATDMWTSTVDAAFINSGTFAVGFMGIKVGGFLSALIELDYCEITIYYTEGIPPVSAESALGPAIQVI